MYMLKFDKDGNYLWSVILSGTSSDDAVWEIKETSNGGYIAAAVTHSSEVTGDPETELDYLLIKLNSDGKLEYTQRYGNSGFMNFTSTLLEANDGHYILGGISYHYKTGEKPLVIKVSKTNNDILWTYDGTKSLEIIPHSCEEVLAVDGGYLVFGTANGENDKDISVVMLDENGQFLWQRLISHEGNESLDREYPCRVTSDNGIIIGAKNTLNNDSSFLLLKLNKEYDLEWIQKHGDDNYNETMMGIVETQDGGYAFIGMVNEGDNTRYKTVIIKLDEIGLY